MGAPIVPENAVALEAKSIKYIVDVDPGVLYEHRGHRLEKGVPDRIAERANTETETHPLRHFNTA